MSTKRQPRTNDEAYEWLQALFIEIAEGEGNSVDHLDHVWRQILENAWFQREIHVQAAHLVGSADQPLFHDLCQQVVIQFREKLRKHGDLGGDARQLRTNFPGWLGNIIKNACIDTLRKELRHPHSEVTESCATHNPFPREDLRLDMAEVIGRFESRERQVAQCRLHELTIHETAELLDLSDRQVERSLMKVRAVVRRVLAIYWKEE